MRIKELNLKNFGRFHQRDIYLSDGINVIYGENGSGKSTIHTFIRAMLFGLEKMRGKTSKNDSYRLYEPWEQSLYYEGSMRFEIEGRQFLLKRGFHPKNRYEELINEVDGESLSVEQGDLQNLLDGLTEAGYRNTCSISQMRYEIENSFEDIIKNFIINSEPDAEGTVDAAAALRRLETERKRLEGMYKDLDLERRKKSEALKSALAYMEEELLELNREYAEQEPEETEFSKEFQVLFPVLPAAVLAVSAVLFLLGTFSRLWLLPAFGGIVLSFFSYRRNKSKQDAKREEYEAELAKWREYKQKIQWKRERNFEEIQEKTRQTEELREQIADSQRSYKGMQELETEMEAVKLAYEEIKRLVKEAESSVVSYIKREASEIFREITDNAYRGIHFDEELKAAVLHEEKSLAPLQVSEGTAEQMYFAVRMAFVKLFYGERKMPILLDDTFGMYDNKRLENTLKWMGKQKMQILLFTCHTREEELLYELGIPFLKTEL